MKRNYEYELWELKRFSNISDDYAVKKLVREYVKTGDIGAIPESVFELTRRTGLPQYQWLGMGSLAERQRMKSKTPYDEALSRYFRRAVYGDGVQKGDVFGLSSYPFYALFWHFESQISEIQAKYETDSRGNHCICFKSAQKGGKILVSLPDYFGWLDEYSVMIRGENAVCNNFLSDKVMTFKEFNDLYNLTFQCNTGHYYFNYNGFFNDLHMPIEFIPLYRIPKRTMRFTGKMCTESQFCGIELCSFVHRAEQALCSYRTKDNYFFFIDFSKPEYIDWKHKDKTAERKSIPSKDRSIISIIRSEFDSKNGIKTCFENGKWVFYVNGSDETGKSTIRVEIILSSVNGTDISSAAESLVRAYFEKKNWSTEFIDEITVNPQYLK